MSNQKKELSFNFIKMDIIKHITQNKILITWAICPVVCTYMFIRFFKEIQMGVSGMKLQLRTCDYRQQKATTWEH